MSRVASSPELLSANPLSAWMRNGLLHVTGLTTGEVWSVYSVTGALVYRTVATDTEADITLVVNGVYIVQSGDNTVRVVFD